MKKKKKKKNKEKLLETVVRKENSKEVLDTVVVRANVITWMIASPIIYISIHLLIEYIREPAVIESFFRPEGLFGLLLCDIVIIVRLFKKVTFTKNYIKIRSLLLPLMTLFKIRSFTMKVSWKDCMYVSSGSLRGTTYYDIDIQTPKLTRPVKIYIWPFWETNVYRVLQMVERYLPSKKWMIEYELNKLRDKGKI